MSLHFLARFRPSSDIKIRLQLYQWSDNAMHLSFFLLSQFVFSPMTCTQWLPFRLSKCFLNLKLVLTWRLNSNRFGARLEYRHFFVCVSLWREFWNWEWTGSHTNSVVLFWRLACLLKVRERFINYTVTITRSWSRVVASFTLLI